MKLIWAAVMDDWGLKATAIGIVLAAFGRFFAERAKEKREQKIEDAKASLEQRIADAKEARELKASNDRLAELREIRVSNKEMCSLLEKQVGRLETVVAVNDSHHRELINAINGTCKAKPVFPVEQKEN